MDMQFIHVWNDSDNLLHITSKNDLEKIVEMKEEHCYFVNEDSHSLAALNSFKFKSHQSENNHSHSVTENKDVVISYDVKIHQDACLNTMKEIVNKYLNL